MNQKNKKNMHLRRELGLIAATSIVIGNIIGSGIFNLPRSLAQIATPSWTIIAWIITSLGSLAIVMSYAKLSRVRPNSGGPVVFAEEAFGHFGGFITAWIWWLSSAIGNAAIVSLVLTTFIHIVSAINEDFGAFTAQPLQSLLFMIFLIVTFTYVNVRGVKQAGAVSVITTILKLSVFGFFILLAMFHFDMDNIKTVSADVSKTTPSVFSMLTGGIALVLWAYTGIESSTLAGDEIKNPDVNLPRSTMFGVLISGGVYLLVTILMMGVLPQDALALETASPFADAFSLMLGGSFWGVLVNVAILISVIGALSGWFLTTGRSAYAAAENGYFFKKFGTVHKKYRTPSYALIASAAVTIGLLFVSYFVQTVGFVRSEFVTEQFDNIILIAGFLNLPTYLITTCAELVIVRRSKTSVSKGLYLRIALSIVFSIFFIIFGAYGTTVPYYYWIFGLGLVLSGVPLYLRYFKTT